LAPLPIIFFASIVAVIQASMYGYAEYAERTRRGPLCTRPGVARGRQAFRGSCAPYAVRRTLCVVRCAWYAAHCMRLDVAFACSNCSGAYSCDGTSGYAVAVGVISAVICLALMVMAGTTGTPSETVVKVPLIGQPARRRVRSCPHAKRSGESLGAGSARAVGAVGNKQNTQTADRVSLGTPRRERA
jgi:hypothetical protein